MTRGIKKRTWVKLDCQGVLHGSINWLFTLEQQAIFLKLIPMAAVYCQKPGIISDNEGKPLPREFIAHELHCPLDVLESVIQKGTSDNCLRDTERGIELVNFKYYQFTEYDRQRPFREKKKAEERKLRKRKYGSLLNVELTDDEYNKLIQQLGEKEAQQWIEKISLGKAAKGYKYKSDYAAILKWQQKEEDGKDKDRRLPGPKDYEPTAEYPDL